MQVTTLLQLAVVINGDNTPVLDGLTKFKDFLGYASINKTQDPTLICFSVSPITCPPTSQSHAGRLMTTMNWLQYRWIVKTGKLITM